MAVKLSDKFDTFYAYRQIVSESEMWPTVYPRGGSKIHIAQVCKIFLMTLTAVKYQRSGPRFLLTVGSEPLYEILV